MCLSYTVPKKNTHTQKASIERQLRHTPMTYVSELFCESCLRFLYRLRTVEKCLIFMYPEGREDWHKWKVEQNITRHTNGILQQLVLY